MAPPPDLSILAEKTNSNANSLNTFASWLYGKMSENMNLRCWLQPSLDRPDEDSPVVAFPEKESANLNITVVI